MVECYPDGVWLAEFVPIADPALVAFILSMHEQPGRDMFFAPCSTKPTDAWNLVHGRLGRMLGWAGASKERQAFVQKTLKIWNRRGDSNSWPAHYECAGRFASPCI